MCMSARLLGSLGLLVLLGCQSRAASPVDGRSCEERRAQLLQVLQQLPEVGLAASIDVGLPSSTLRGSFGKGSILELSESRLSLDGRAIPGETHPERRSELARRVAELEPSLPLYIAAAWNTDVATLNEVVAGVPKRVDVRLLFAAPAIPEGEPELEPSSHAAKVLAERDVARRHALAAEGYAATASCEPVERAVRSVSDANVKERWPRLKRAMSSAVQQCDCDDVDADGLRELLVAEQRAGSVALGSIPISFLRDQRCAAAMPLRSTQQLLDEIGEFDAEFAGDWKEDALVFDEVVTDERLLVYLCVALPDETLAWLQRKRSTLYWRPPGDTGCQGWRFEPLARGAPMGTWRRESASGPPLAIHYRQGASEIRLFGPVTREDQRPTDPGPWPCNEDQRMVAVEEDYVQLQSGARWYFDEVSCRQAPPSEPRFSGCVANLAVGIAPPPLPVDDTKPEEAAPSE